MGLFAQLFGGGNTDNITVADYLDQFDTTDHVLIDVRSKEEFKEGHLPGSKLITLQEISSRTDELPTDKPIVLVCRTGSRSRMAAGQLSQAGFDQLYNLKGGTIAWARAGHSLEK